jgi:hypothetical protein
MPLYEGEEALDPLCPKVEWNISINDDGLKLNTTLSKGGIEYFDCFALFNPSRKNWFRISRLVAIIALGL